MNGRTFSQNLRIGEHHIATCVLVDIELLFVSWWTLYFQLYPGEQWIISCIPVDIVLSVATW